MRMIYDPIPFVKLVQKNFSWKLWANYGYLLENISHVICTIYKCCSCCELKINLQNVYPPCTNMKVPNGRLSGDGSVQARRHGGHLGTVTPKSFLCPEILLCSEKFVSKHMIKTKILPPQKCILPTKPKNLAMGLVLPKLRLQLEYSVLKSIRSRDVS